MQGLFFLTNGTDSLCLYPLRSGLNFPLLFFRNKNPGVIIMEQGLQRHCEAPDGFFPYFIQSPPQKGRIAYFVKVSAEQTVSRKIPSLFVL